MIIFCQTQEYSHHSSLTSSPYHLFLTHLLIFSLSLKSLLQQFLLLERKKKKRGKKHPLSLTQLYYIIFFSLFFLFCCLRNFLCLQRKWLWLCWLRPSGYSQYLLFYLKTSFYVSMGCSETILKRDIFRLVVSLYSRICVQKRNLL